MPDPTANPLIPPAPEPAPVPAHVRRRGGAGRPVDRYALIRQLIWVYIILWLIEGGLRRWFLPGLATPLLLVRDPVVIAIYFLAAGKNVFPTNGFIIGGAVLAVLTFANALAIGHGNPMVALYGVRCDFLHVPLIFVMGKVLRREDLLHMAKMAMWLAIPYTFLLMAQFEAPQDAWVNRGVGGSMEGAGFIGSGDKFRPPGTFSFITGPGCLYPMFTACWFLMVLAKKMPRWLMIAAGMAIVVAIPVSISRSFFLSVALVVFVGLAAMFSRGRLSGSMVSGVLIMAVLLSILSTQLPAFQSGLEAFGARWQESTTEAGGVKVAIFDRLVDSFTKPFQGIEFFGVGSGYSTNVGQKKLTGELGFGGSEGEWGRIFYDNGLILGLLVVVYRIALAVMLLRSALRAWHRKQPEGIIFLSAALLLVLSGQWGQSTSLGAAIIAGGLALASSQLDKPEVARKRPVKESGSNSEPSAPLPGTGTASAPFSVTN